MKESLAILKNCFLYHHEHFFKRLCKPYIIFFCSFFRSLDMILMGTSSGFETAATMLGGSTALGYIVVGLLAFVLGVCVTVLCFRIRRLNEEEQTGEQKGENADGSHQ